MGKTYKKLPRLSFKEVGKKEVPYDRHCYMVYSAAAGMAKKGRSFKQRVSLLRFKFKLPRLQAEELARWSERYK